MAFHGELLEAYAGLGAGLQALVRVAVVLAAGYVLVRLLRWVLRRSARVEAPLDRTVRVFLERLAVSGGYVAVTLVALYAAGVDPVALVGGLAVGGFVIGFATKDALGNLAAGLVLLVYRPFDLGDTVRVAGEVGTVQELGFALTVMTLPDGRIMTVPNGAVLGAPIINFTRNPIRRADIRVAIAYEDDLNQAVVAILDGLSRWPQVLQDPAPQVVVTNLGEDAVDLEIRAWARNAEFGDVLNGLRPRVKGLLEAVGCSVAPMPRREIVLRK